LDGRNADNETTLKLKMDALHVVNMFFKKIEKGLPVESCDFSISLSQYSYLAKYIDIFANKDLLAGLKVPGGEPVMILGGPYSMLFNWDLLGIKFTENSLIFRGETYMTSERENYAVIYVTVTAKS